MISKTKLMVFGGMRHARERVINGEITVLMLNYKSYLSTQITVSTMRLQTDSTVVADNHKVTKANGMKMR